MIYVFPQTKNIYERWLWLLFQMQTTIFERLIALLQIAIMT
jgi:hypothetical protein